MLRATIKKIGFRSCSLRRWTMLRFSTVLLTAVIILGLSAPKLTENAQASTGTPYLNDKVLYTQSDFADLKPVPDSYQIAKAYFLPDYQEDMGGVEADPVDQCASLCSGYSKGITSCPEGYTLETCPQTGCGTYGRCVNNCPATVTLSSAEICLETCGGNCVKKEACPTSSLSVPNADKTACICPEQYQKSCPTNSIKGTSTCSVNGETYYQCFCEAGYKCSQTVTYSTGCTGTCVKETASCSQGDYYENSTARATIYKQCNSNNGTWVQTSLNSNSFCGYCRLKTCQELNSSYLEQEALQDEWSKNKTCNMISPAGTSNGLIITCWQCQCPSTVSIPSNGYCTKECEGNCIEIKTCKEGTKLSSDGKSCICDEKQLGDNQLCLIWCNLGPSPVCSKTEDCPVGKTANASHSRCLSGCPEGTYTYGNCPAGQSMDSSVEIKAENGDSCFKCYSNDGGFEQFDPCINDPTLAGCINNPEDLVPSL